jgi:hypothetical protein
VHELHAKQGGEAAWVLGKKLGLKEGTLRSWFAAWKRADANVAPKAKKASSKVAEKANA